MRQEAEKLASYSRTATSIDLTSEEALLQIQKLELRITELELQNENLATKNNENESIAKQFSTFFLHAPTAYLIVSKTGKIVTANIKGATLFGKELSQLKRNLYYQ